MNELEINRAGVFGTLPHGFFGRRGGVSTGIVAGLQVGLGADDDAAAIAENRRRIVEALIPKAPLATLYQIHSANVVRVLSEGAAKERPEGDALVTDRPGILLGILTADCAPVLFMDEAAGVVGAAHAGWKGAIAGVTDRTIAAMEKLGAKADRIHAAIGPCIAQKSYEVDAGFLEQFCESNRENERFFGDGQRKDHFQFDLEGYVAARLAEAGIRTVEAMGLDTYSQPGRFFSFRRATHLGEPNYGRQMSVIGLPNP
jgi:polyphenol oxidase